MLKSSFLCLLLLIALGVSACESEILPPTDSDEPFSMYGILNPRQPIQTIAVAPIEPLLFDYPDSLDAVVTSTDLEFGEIVTWRDSTTSGSLGQTDHIYWTKFNPLYGRDYLVEVVRSDGATSSAVASIPHLVDVWIGSTGPRSIDLGVSGSDFVIHQAEIVYTVRLHTIFSEDVCRGPEDRFIVNRTSDVKESVGGYTITINLDRDHLRIISEYNLNWIEGISRMALMKMEVLLLVGDPAWQMPDRLSETPIDASSVPSNVTNGFGVVAGGYQFDERIYPPEDVVDTARFFDFMPRPPQACLDYCLCRSSKYVARQQAL